MYVNNRVELAQRGIALWKMYALFIIIITIIKKRSKDVTGTQQQRRPESPPVTHSWYAST